MWSAERRRGDERSPVRQQPRDRVDPRHLERFFSRQRGQDSRQAAGKHRLARPGRPRQQQVVPTGSGKLERTTCPLLAANVGQVRNPRGSRQLFEFLERLGLPLTAKVGRRLGEMMEWHRLDPRERGLRSRCRRAEQPRKALLLCALRRRKDAGDRADPSVQGELADRRVSAKALLRYLPRGRKHRQGNGQIEARSLLAELGGSQVDRQPPEWPRQFRRCDAASYPLLRLLAGAIGQTDDRERREPILEMSLYLDAARIEADERVGDRPRQHAADASRESATYL